MGESTMQQLALEIRQLRNEVAVLVQRFNALEERTRQPGNVVEEGPTAPRTQDLPLAPPAPIDAGPVTDADYQRAVALARGIITRPPGAGGDRS